MEIQDAANVLLAVLSGVAISVSFYTFYKSKRERSYADIDCLYLELLKLGIQHPKFVNPKNTSNYKNAFKGDELSRYEIYAYISWNICETIYDRKDDILFETWKPVIVAENKLHRRWFDNPENHHKFKDRFRDYIQNNYPQDYKNTK
jgi:hypothetical protein